MITAKSRLRLEIQGVVQGVGFRPHVYRLARELGLVGWVCNSAVGASIEVEGEGEGLKTFLDRLQKNPPAHASLRRVEVTELPLREDAGFEIHESQGGPMLAPVLPDLAACSRCLEEIFDPLQRRYLYPFTNCTHCGPRFSIVEALPYDRANTTMKVFPMCAACREEYENPGDRRFHAQPIACPDCGPHLELWNSQGKCLATRHAALLQAVAALQAGEIVAVKGVGGFHLLANARCDGALSLLRRRKGREEKPFAALFPSLGAVRDVAEVSGMEAAWLTSQEAPIVLLQRRPGSVSLGEAVAPGIPTIGAMLPSNPIQHLLLSELGFPVVATSGNLSEEPICIDEHDALRRLKGLADFFLVHNRPIARHVDDSILRVVAGREMMLRRARGFAPLPFAHPNSEPILALGAHIKNTVALGLDGQIFVSQHIGDLRSPQALAALEDVSARLKAFYAVESYHASCDLHPDYASTQLAERLGRPLVRAQHHHAHVVSCMVEHGLEGAVLGVAWDGSGYGPDGSLWGGEFLLATRGKYERVGHFLEFPLPGGEAAVREPRRAALGLLYGLFGEELFTGEETALREFFTFSEWRLLREMLLRQVRCPLTSSVGRLFDGVAALLKLRAKTSFEGQAAIQLEFLAAESSHEEGYPLPIQFRESILLLDWRSMLAAMLGDLRNNLARSHVARRFHNTLAETVVAMARRVGEKRVVLSGGCFQNRLLTEGVVSRLRAAGFEPWWHRRIPPNDGGISLGQVAIAAEKIRS